MRKEHGRNDSQREEFRQAAWHGVAIKCDDDLVRKFKVTAVSVCHDGDGQHVSGIAVCAPLRQQVHWKRVGWMRLDLGRWWIHPQLVFRSKGECLRHYADEDVAQANRSIERFRDKIEEHRRALDGLKQLLQEEERKMGECLKKRKKFMK